jgi:tellurite resistance protein
MVEAKEPMMPAVTRPDKRPPRFPAPQFPVKKPKLFAATPPALFLVLLGLLGLGLALRKSATVTGLPGEPVEALLGALLGLWGFAIVALTVKMTRRPMVLIEDMRPLPGRAGLAAASMSGMAAGAVLLPYAPGVALVLTLVSLFAHALLAAILINVLAREPEGKTVNPTWQLSYVGFIAAAPVLVDLGWPGVARVIFALTFLAELGIGLMSVVQLSRRIPPAALRPMLALHLAAVGLLSTTAALIGQETLAFGLALAAAFILAALVISARWLLAAGFTPLWGAITFPLAAGATAFLTLGGNFTPLGLILTLACLAVIPPIAWQILKLWPGGRLAAKTNAAEA